MRRLGCQSQRLCAPTKAGIGIPAYAVVATVLSISAMAGAPGSPADCRIGPWQLGMTREQAASFADTGSFQPDTSDAGAEYVNAVVDGSETRVRLGFENNKLTSMEASNYEGSDLSAAKVAILEVFDMFTGKLGGAELPPLKLNDQAVFDRPAMEIFIDRILGRSAKVAEETDAKAKKDGKKGVVMTFVFDLVPVNQPRDCHLHSQLVYSSERAKYAVTLFEDLPGSKSRQVKANIHVDYVK